VGGKSHRAAGGNGKEEEMRAKILLFSVSCLLFSALPGCGYTSRSLIADRYKTICVEPFANKIDVTTENASGSSYKVYRPLLESDITRAVNNRFLLDGNLKPATKDTADLVLSGELVEFRRDPLRYLDNDDVAEYRINVIVNLSMWDRKENKTVWEEHNFTGDTTYFTTGSLAQSEDSAVINAVNDLARRVVERAVEQW
jgi:hypothetical protein